MKKIVTISHRVDSCWECIDYCGEPDCEYEEFPDEGFHPDCPLPNAVECECLDVKWDWDKESFVCQDCGSFVAGGIAAEDAEDEDGKTQDKE